MAADLDTDYVNTVMVQDNVTAVPVSCAQPQESGRKRPLSSCVDDRQTSIGTKKMRDDTQTNDASLIQQIKLITDELRVSFETRYDLLEDRMRNQLAKMIKSELDDVRKSFNDRLENFSKRFEEKLNDRVSKSLDERLGTVRKEMSSMSDKVNGIQKSYAEVAAIQSNPEKLNVVIRKLATDQAEAQDPAVNLHKVNPLIKDGLKLRNIKVKSAVRKQSRINSKPGVVIATLDTTDQRTKLLKAKSALKQCDRYKRVYIDEDRPVECRRNESNIRTLLNEMGKADNYINLNGRFVGKRANNRH